jgi:hypothetical protein
MNSKMTPERARELRDEVKKGHARCHPQPFRPQPGTQKTRELRFCPREPGQAERALKLLEGLPDLGANPGRRANALCVCYDLREYTLQGLEHALIRQGFRLESGVFWRLQRAMLHFSEETQLRNMRMPERLLKKSHEVYSRAWDHHLHGDHDDTPADLRQER